MATKRALPAHKPAKKVFREKIGKQEYQLAEERLDILSDVTLWNKNPRLQPYVPGAEFASEDDLQAALRRTGGYDALKKSIADVGQMDPIYVWKTGKMKKYLVLEGATRVTILRDLYLAKKGGKHDAEQFRYVTAKVLPEDFSEVDRVILLARIHVRGSGVRSWGRYVEAKFVHDNVTGHNGDKPLMTLAELAAEMGKSTSWVSRLKDAYDFARQYVEEVDDPEAEKQAVEYFSVLEEIAKSTSFGAKVKNPPDDDWKQVRHDVFQMVRNDVFKEYRDARFMQQFYDDPEKWQLLKSHENGIAHKLAAEVKAGGSSLKGRVAGLHGQIDRALARDPKALDDSDLDDLKLAVGHLESHLFGASMFRVRVREFVRSLEEASLSDVKKLRDDELNALEAGLEDLKTRRVRALQKSA
jgi:hypothetical protein